MKYRSYVFKKTREYFSMMTFICLVATSSCVSNFECKVFDRLMISPRHSTSFSLIKQIYLFLCNISLLDTFFFFNNFIHILRVFFGFCCFILFILTLQIYCFCSHNRTITSMPTISIVLLIKLVGYLLTL